MAHSLARHIAAPRVGPARPAHPQFHAHSSRAASVRPLRAVEIDWSDPDTIIGTVGCVLGVVVGVGTVAWYGRVVERDDERMQNIRELNKANYEATGEYMSSDEIQKMRGTKWTDRREFKDDD